MPDPSGTGGGDAVVADAVEQEPAVFRHYRADAGRGSRAQVASPVPGAGIGSDLAPARRASALSSPPCWRSVLHSGAPSPGGHCSTSYLSLSPQPQTSRKKSLTKVGLAEEGVWSKVTRREAVWERGSATMKFRSQSKTPKIELSMRSTQRSTKGGVHPSVF